MGRKGYSYKEEVVERLQKLIAQYPTIAIGSLEKVKAAQLQELRKRFRGKVEIHVAKNTLMRKVFEALGEGREKLIPYLSGQNIFLFAKDSPFDLELLLEGSKVMVQAKAGDIAPKDIVIPAGNTGLPAGPVISELNAVGLRTKIEAGSVWITSDAVVAKKGETISANLASVLAKLGIKPIETRLMLKVAYSDNLILTAEQLSLDIPAIEKSLKEVYSQALNLALGIEYPTLETLPALLIKAHGQARLLGIEASYESPDLIADILIKAEAFATILASKVYGSPS
ncbi:MAG: 50S ribosomal protein L10 [Candidatus Bathyarchaeia archaeon]